ncbi:hypothetical protein GGX14DRAFT_566337 [Mycena pura]|uniref:Uncharacterized protein n=1 Tax=Mycena pura TaxID=153505 RepID=A0AAD6VCR1_9AGAR|nr:hypothetical protein GGX14DRAFT_566337 [Mycena pura]
MRPCDSERSRLRICAPPAPAPARARPRTPPMVRAAVYPFGRDAGRPKYNYLAPLSAHASPPLPAARCPPLPPAARCPLPASRLPPPAARLAPSTLGSRFPAAAARCLLPAAAARCPLPTARLPPPAARRPPPAARRPPPAARLLPSTLGSRLPAARCPPPAARCPPPAARRPPARPPANQPSGQRAARCPPPALSVLPATCRPANWLHNYLALNRSSPPPAARPHPLLPCSCPPLPPAAHVRRFTRVSSAADPYIQLRTAWHASHLRLIRASSPIFSVRLTHMFRQASSLLPALIHQAKRPLSSAHPGVSRPLCGACSAMHTKTPFWTRRLTCSPSETNYYARVPSIPDIGVP